MIKGIIYAVLFILALWLVFSGAKIVGYNGILMMMGGIAILLGELYTYNKRYQ